jgi:mevalonate pyrophosphate decarboxylase
VSVCVSVCQSVFVCVFTAYLLSDQVAPASHWPEMEVLIMVVSAHKKDTSSTDGMITSVQTSDLLKVVPIRCHGPLAV